MDKFMNEVFTREKLIAELALPDNIFLLAYTVIMLPAMCACATGIFLKFHREQMT
jgi:hypothetical protein